VGSTSSTISTRPLQTAEELPPREHVFEHRRAVLAGAGFEGFPELQQAARDEYRRARPTRPHAHAVPLFSLDQTSSKRAGADHVNVEDTAHKLSGSS